MMIVDEPFAAPELIEYLVRTQEPVLVNDMRVKSPLITTSTFWKAGSLPNR